jgi:hypothetical protein
LSAGCPGCFQPAGRTEFGINRNFLPAITAIHISSLKAIFVSRQYISGLLIYETGIFDNTLVFSCTNVNTFFKFVIQ